MHGKHSTCCAIALAPRFFNSGEGVIHTSYSGVIPSPVLRGLFWQYSGNPVPVCKACIPALGVISLGSPQAGLSRNFFFILFFLGYTQHYSGGYSKLCAQKSLLAGILGIEPRSRT